MKTILAPVDFSDTTDEVIEKTTLMAKTFGASVTLMHVVGLEADMAGFVGDAAFMSVPVNSKVAEVQKVKAQEELDKRAQSLRDQGITVETVVETDYAAPAHCILEYLENNETDLVIIGTHGHGALYHLLLGGVAESVVRRAPCPVLVVHSIPHAERNQDKDTSGEGDE